MSDWLVVLLKIAAMFLVILVGWVARRRAYLTAETTSTLSRFVVDLAIPAMVFTQMLGTVDATELRASWYLPIVGGAIIVVGQLVGLATMPLLSRRDQRTTFIFLVAIANWIYLPLPIADALYGAEGVRAVLLFNVGAQLVLWTLGVWTIRGGRPDMEALRNLATNPGLIATALGITVALLLPGARELVDPALITAHSSATTSLRVAGTFIQALTLVGSLTIPLSLIVTGAQLGGLDLSDHRPSLTLSGVLLSRLLLGPLATVLLVWGVMRAGWAIPEVPRMVTYIIAAMPVAVSCSMFTERFGGDTSLAARAIFYTTLFSIVTVPVLFFLVRQFGL